MAPPPLLRAARLPFILSRRQNPDHDDPPSIETERPIIRRHLPQDFEPMRSFFASRVALFVVRIATRRRGRLLRIPYSFGMNWLKAALVGGTAFWLALFLFGIGPEGEISKTYGGLCWQSAAYPLWESFFALGAILGIVVIFRERFDWGGRFARFMADNSFSVYVFHPPILILVTLALRGFAWHPLVKFAVAVAAAVAVPLCFVASELVLRRIPLLKRESSVR